MNAAVKAQVDRLGHVSTLYPTLPIVQLAETLARITPGRLQKSYFTCSGTEADETAVVLAQVYTGRLEIIALRHGYSGRSILAQSLTAHSPWRAVPTQIAGIKHAPSPYCYRCPLKLTYPSCGVACAKDLEELIRTTTTGQIAGFLAEPIQGVGGFITPPKEYFEIAVGIVRKYGGVFICDEVQTGFGRTGDPLVRHLALERRARDHDDGQGRRERDAARRHDRDARRSRTRSRRSRSRRSAGTRSPRPPRTRRSPSWRRSTSPKRAAEMGARLRAGLDGLKKKYPKTIGDVRGMGLMQGLELVADETVQDRTPAPEKAVRLFEETKKRGLLIGKGGLYGNVIRISPPLDRARRPRWTTR